MSAPKIPNFTCRDIDRGLEGMVHSLDWFTRSVLESSLTDIKDHIRDWESEVLEDIKSFAEEIRENNSNLRYCAEYYKDKCENLSD